MYAVIEMLWNKQQLESLRVAEATHVSLILFGSRLELLYFLH